MTSPNKQKYVKMNPIDHILHRPSMYVGSTISKEIEDYISKPDNGFQIVKKVLKYSPALLRVFIEPLSNAIDNVSRSKKTKTQCTIIKVNVDKKTGKTRIWNNGEVIPVELNNEEKCYNHSLIFGQLLTSSNYNDDEERYNISGTNGVGIKTSNVFSSYFKVKGLDPVNKKIIEQEWTQNMKQTQDPTITSTKEKHGYTEVSWIPDFSQFKVKGYTQDVIDLYCKYVVDSAMLTGIDVYFNDILIPVKSLKDYSKLYGTIDEDDVLEINTKDAKVLVTPSSSFQFISFANGVYTSLGGTHVDAWTEALFRPIVDKLTQPKEVTYTIADVKKFFKIFVAVNVINPTFESQSKLRLESPTTASVKPKDIKTLLGWSVIDDIKRAKEFGALKKLERKKKTFVKIDGLDPANNAGGKLSHECTLSLVEGLSAKQYAVRGIEVGAFGKVGRDFHGIYSLRGKCLNVRNSKTATIAKNSVISDIIKALGLRIGVDYTDDENYKTLQYGRVMLICDQDVDGIHIVSLLQNFFHVLFPSLLQREQSFLTSMQTPIVRVFLDKKDILFYDENEYRKYVEKYRENYPDKKINKKYYKGLGSSSASDIMETFGQKLIEFKNDDNINITMNKVFHKKQSNARKTWIGNYNDNNTVIHWDGSKKEIISVSISDFLDTETIKFSRSDCTRSIPHIMDGLKEGQRKVLYACFLKNLKYSGKVLKVIQLAGYTSEHTGYQHGEQNLYETITGMANSYIGSNNIPLLYRDGSYGSRLSGGKDAASARYIFTKLDMLTRLLFRLEDDVLLDYIVEDGDSVEPHFYVPILPTLLINGADGIGTGWSSTVPTFNPIDLIESVRVWLEQDGKIIETNNSDNTTISLLPELTPWYRGFTGKIEKTDETKYTTWGHITPDKKTFIVDELPIGLWTDKFKENLDNLLEEKMIKNAKNYSTPETVKFVLTESSDGFECNENNLKLYSYIHTSNMVVFTDKGNIKKYDTVDQIIDAFCCVRYEYYIKRKKHQLGQLNDKIKFLGNKRRFLEEVMNGDIKLFTEVKKENKIIRKSRKMTDIINDLEQRGYDKTKTDDDDEGDEENNSKGYRYLLCMQFGNVTEEKINKLKKDIASHISQRDLLSTTSEKQMWLSELKEFEIEYAKYLVVLLEEGNKNKKKKK